MCDAAYTYYTYYVWLYLLWLYLLWLYLLWLYLLGAPSVAFIDDTNATHPNVTLVAATVAFGTFRGQVRQASRPASQPATEQVRKSASPQVRKPVST